MVQGFRSAQGLHTSSFWFFMLSFQWEEESNEQNRCFSLTPHAELTESWKMRHIETCWYDLASFGVNIPNSRSESARRDYWPINQLHQPVSWWGHLLVLLGGVLGSSLCICSASDLKPEAGCGSSGQWVKWFQKEWLGWQPTHQRTNELYAIWYLHMVEPIISTHIIVHYECVSSRYHSDSK